MGKTDKILECAANVSYGINDKNLKKITDAIHSVENQKLLDIDSSASANRSVLTFAGEPMAVTEAAFQLIKTTSEIVDMRLHKGAHPRLGATDVCPFVPLQGCSKKEAIEWIRLLALKVGNELSIPVYLYELSARKGYRSMLPQIRKGGYESLLQKMAQAKWQPDFGPEYSIEHQDSILRTGATIIGVRNILVAFNISLATHDRDTAKKIAFRLRTIGWPKSREQEAMQTTNYSLPALRAIGWFSEDYGCAQVSFNFLRYKRTTPLEVWELVKELATEYNTSAIGCEVIGLIPEECILEAGYFAAAQSKIKQIHSYEELITLGCEHMQFNRVRPFDPMEKILEYRLEEL